jgi:arsenate reductase (thioredoxin)
VSSADVSADAGVVGKLSTLDRFLPVWILAAMLLGLGAGRAIPGLGSAINAVDVDGISLPIALGLLIMMYPVLAKVRYDRLGTVTSDRRLLLPSLLLNWIVGPALMFALAWLLLPDLPAYRTGLIIVGLARCIAMVIIWNDLACGDREAAAVLVALNSVFQVIAFGVLGWFYLSVLPAWLGLPGTGLDISGWAIARSVLIFLGIPLVAGYLTRQLGERARGRDWYESRFLPRIGPFALYGLLFTIVVLFALQGGQITSHPLDVARIAVPLLVYFAIMWAGSFALGRTIGLSHGRTTTLAFTAAGNNFELAIAVAIATFGVASGQALAGVVGPLIEVPVLVALVYAALWARRFFTTTPVATAPEAEHDRPPVASRERLRAIAKTRGVIVSTTPEVLFVCVHNAGRSQMAAALLHHHAAGSVTVRSAGSAPAGSINPAVVAVMAELGLDLTQEFPKPLTDDAVQAADVVITMGCGDACPVYPGKRYLNWELDDPAGRGVDAVRPIRDEIDRRVTALLAELVPA